MLRNLTIVFPYYMNGGMFQEQQKFWNDLPLEILNQLRFIVVDDGSPTNKAQDNILKRSQAKLSIYYVTVDVPWNQDHARNLGASKCDTEWVFFTDIDHVVPYETLLYMLEGKFNPNKYYTFARKNAITLEDYHYHPNSFLIAKNTYWRTGGYDEEFAGYYGTDGYFKRRLDKYTKGEEHVEDHFIIRFSREIIPDASTTTLKRKEGRDMKRKMEIGRIAAHKLEHGIRPKILSFPYIQVL
jgi:predicted glycosyltransferase involved in capsule biosynthesis